MNQRRKSHILPKMLVVCLLLFYPIFVKAMNKKKKDSYESLK